MGDPYEFKLCATCAKDPMVPPCASCQHNRMAIAVLQMSIPKTTVPFVPIEWARKALADMSESQRRDFFEAIADGYCLGCGTTTPPHCHCQNDE